MCLIYDKEETEELKEKYKRNRKTFIKGYKVVRREDSEVRSTHFYHYWNAGWNRADRNSYKNQTLSNLAYLYNGIHVYATRQRARETQRRYGSYYYVLPVRCYIKDLIGVSIPLHRSMVFTKVWVDKAELAKIKRKKKCV